MKYLLFTLLGMFLMFIVLKILSSKKTVTASETTAALRNFVLTPQVGNLLKTNEAKEAIKTPEFKYLLKTVADQQLQAISMALTTYGTKG